MKNIAIGFVLAMLLSACNTTTVVPPQSPRQTIVMAYVAVEMAADTLNAAKEQNKISAERRHEIADKLQTALDTIKLSEQALQAYEASKLVNKPDVASQEQYQQQLEIVYGLVLEVNTYLTGLDINRGN